MIRTSVAVTAAALGTLAVSVATAPTAAGAPAVPPPLYEFVVNLEALMVPADDIAAITGARQMRVADTATTLNDLSDTVRPAQCIGAFEPAQVTAYGRGWNSVHTQIVADGKPGSTTHMVNQSVIRFDDDTAAATQLTRSARTWKSCGGTAVTMTTDTGDYEFTLGHPTALGDGSGLVLTHTGKHGTCERAMAGHDSIVVDVMACAFSGGAVDGQAAAIAKAITDSISGRGD
ncbi:sensor domain-containing protein [Mycobacterium hubeiense]|uniref:sensor domain-containing protein n=1 Tax=Mycobacterium hubeiense TaxID=1867256 RepID=UPI001304545C|nr:sensor domain-containing protein [Mycobacterium sp. QGD 101]